MNVKQMDYLIEKLNIEKEKISKIFDNSTKTYDFLCKDMRRKLLELFLFGTFIFVSCGSFILYYMTNRNVDVVLVTNLSYILLFDSFIASCILSYLLNKKIELQTGIRYYKSDDWISYVNDKNEESIMAFKIYVFNELVKRLEHKKSIYKEIEKDYIIECYKPNSNIKEKKEDLKNRLNNIEMSINEKIYNLILIKQFNHIRSRFKVFGALTQKIFLALIYGASVSALPLIIINKNYDVSFSPLRIFIPMFLTTLATILINYLAQKEELIAFLELNKFGLPEILEYGEYSSIKIKLEADVAEYIDIKEEIERLKMLQNM